MSNLIHTGQTREESADDYHGYVVDESIRSQRGEMVTRLYREMYDHHVTTCNGAGELLPRVDAFA